MGKYWSHTPEAIEKIRKAKLGDKNPMYGKTNEKCPNWVGDTVGYSGIHDWLAKNYGQPKTCEICERKDKKRYEWALVKGKKYERKRKNFIRLCKRCHNDYDCVNICQQIK